MPTLRPIPHAYVPVDSAAAARVSAPNYDEFQSDREVWDLLQQRPDNVLNITMPHCHVSSPEEIIEDGCEEALAHAAQQMQLLKQNPLFKTVENAVWVYSIQSPKRPDAPQLGVGGFGLTSEIRTEANPSGCIIRNEGIRPEKAEGRAQLLQATDADFGTVNLAVQDEKGELLRALEEIVRSRSCDFETLDEGGNLHRSWMLTDVARVENEAAGKLMALLAKEPAAYVADGNHRSAAAAMLGKDHFLTVFFPVSRLGLKPYNRLLPLNGLAPSEFLEKLTIAFTVTPLGKQAGYRPADVGVVGLYLSGQWHELRPKASSRNNLNAAEVIDADYLQQHLIAGILGFPDPRDKKINYVGGNKDATYLMSQVDAGQYDLALSLAPVTMQQFVDVCEQNLFMPPKSTWFDPKIRSGLMIASID